MDKFVEKTEWVEYLQRRQPLFILALFAKPETILLKRVTGVPTQHQLNLHKNGVIYWLRRPQEMTSAAKYFASLLDSNDERLAEWARLGIYYDNRTDELIKQFSAKKFKVDIKDYKSIIRECENIFLYCTIIPYWVMDGWEISNKKAKDKHKTKFLKQFEFLRSQRKYPQIAEKVFKKFWQAAAKLQNIGNYKIFSNSTPYELERLFYLGNKINPRILRKRAVWSMFKLRSPREDFNFIYDRSMASKIPALAKPAKGLKEVQGTVAFPGKVQGRVRVIHEKSNLNLFKAGEVIVSPSTSPSLMPALLKCSAIVTDEGGMGSHAAIIARELSKPCIIGVKNATHVFRTGNMVEVDADKGIVKKLPHN